ncbi:Hypothetical predicted protein [Olea europaea subsp. europaea]|uniref:Uncharacterized protein n=1 Tax=Olea europaea subsp. europaea TaxID=158383 RepID=A0A8S0SXD1_OLEEU|nr:Hypothetical predicted protein [Olea europaea subsp. europaea]
MMSTQTSWGSNSISQPSLHVGSQPSLHLGSQSRASHDTGNGTIQDPKCSKRKGAPKKLRHKSSLESTSKKIKTASTSSKGQRSRAAKSNLRPNTPIVESLPHVQYSMMTRFSNSQVIAEEHQVEADAALRQCFSVLKEFGVVKYLSDHPEVKAEYLSCLRHLSNLMSSYMKTNKRSLEELKEEIQRLKVEISRNRRREH